MVPVRALLVFFFLTIVAAAVHAKDGVIFAGKNDRVPAPLANEEIYWMIDPQQDVAAYSAQIEEIRVAYEALRKQKEAAAEKAKHLLADYHQRIETYRASVARNVATASSGIAIKLQRLEEEESRQRFEYPTFARDFADWQQRNVIAVKEKHDALEASRAEWKKKIADLDSHTDDGAVGKQVLDILGKIAAREKLPLSQFARSTVPHQIEEYLTWSQSETGRYDNLVRQAYIHPGTRSIFFNLTPKISMYGKERIEIEALLAKLVSARDRAPVELVAARRELSRIEHQLAETPSAKVVPMSERLSDAAARFDAIDARRASLKQELASLTGGQERMVDRLIAGDPEIAKLRTDQLEAEADARLDLQAAKAQLCAASAAKIAHDRIAGAQKVRTGSHGEFVVPNEAYRAFSFHSGEGGFVAWDEPSLEKKMQVQLDHDVVVEGVNNREQLLNYVTKSETSLWIAILDSKIEAGSSEGEGYRAARK